MILGRIQINSVDSTGVFEAERQDIVASRGDCEDNIIGPNLEKTCVGSIIFPRESVNVAVVESGVF